MGLDDYAYAEYSFGALERKTPLPPGRYWIDVFGDLRAPFHAWAKGHYPDVVVTTVQSFEKAPIRDDHVGNKARDFVIFEVKKPVPWHAPTFGFPTIATKDVQSEQDTGDTPKETDWMGNVVAPVTTGQKILGAAKIGIGLIVSIGLGALGVKLYRKF